MNVKKSELKMSRPYIVCHMSTSINGKISGPFMAEEEQKIYRPRAYESINNSYNSDAWLCGRVTMEEGFTNFH